MACLLAIIAAGSVFLQRLQCMAKMSGIEVSGSFKFLSSCNMSYSEEKYKNITVVLTNPFISIPSFLICGKDVIFWLYIVVLIRLARVCSNPCRRYV